ncbi:MAG TPA: class II glutamine amidotransferase [Nevskiaceae bacterium]|nr:class II glutamine amidotransferase [Nevskiaceae bacterium]
MCLMIHKPRGAAIPADLLEAAVLLNRDGWGLMGFAPSGDLLLERHAEVSLDDLLHAEECYRGAEYVLHLRRRTRGAANQDNSHPFKVGDGIYLMHNGTLRLDSTVPGMSDTWHLVSEILRPLSQRRPGLLLDHAFQRLLKLALTPENKLALLDHDARRIVLLNQEHGAELDGLWLSSTRWIDRARLPLVTPPQAQERSYHAGELVFA